MRHFPQFSTAYRSTAVAPWRPTGLRWKDFIISASPHTVRRISGSMRERVLSRNWWIKSWSGSARDTRRTIKNERRKTKVNDKRRNAKSDSHKQDQADSHGDF